MVDDDGPKWHKDMFKDLTDDQKKEAEKFGEIMGECFETSGQNCRCEEIPFPSFANACSRAAPLATACDIDGDEKACEKLDNLNMPALPPHLEEVMRRLEGGMNEKRYEMHMPRECQEAGVTSPDGCGKIMITQHAPEECKEALLSANVKSESAGREICDKIMYELRAPECAEQGITDPEECKKFMDDFRGPGGPCGPGGPTGGALGTNTRVPSGASHKKSPIGLITITVWPL